MVHESRASPKFNLISETRPCCLVQLQNRRVPQVFHLSQLVDIRNPELHT